MSGLGLPKRKKKKLTAGGAIIPAQLDVFMESPDAFRRNLMIDASGTTQPFVPEDWQQENLTATDQIWMRVAGLIEDKSIPKYAWIGRSKGHSKTTDEAIQLCWALAFSSRRIMGHAAAASREQAAILKGQIDKLLIYNPWLTKFLRVLGNRVENVNNGSHMTIISSDSRVSHGHEPDFILCDELTHWENEKLWLTLTASSGKRPHCCLIVMTNAGFKDSWQWRIREDARLNPKLWIYRDFDKPVASWITEEMLAAQLHLLAGNEKVFARLWLNQWQSEASDELSLKDIKACINYNAKRMNGDEEDWIFVGGLDLAYKKDRSGFVILASNPDTHEIRLAWCKDWHMTKSIELETIVEEIISQNRIFKMAAVYYDTAQAIMPAQQCAKGGVRMEEMNFKPKNLQMMASAILGVFREHRIELYNDTRLIDDLTKLRIVSKGFVQKIEAPSDSSGHADLGMAFSIALPAAIEYAGRPVFDVSVGDRNLIQTIDDLRRLEDEYELRDKLRAQGLTPPEAARNPLDDGFSDPDQAFQDDPKQRTIPCDACGGTDKACPKCSGRKRIPFEQAVNRDAALMTMALEENGLGNW